MSWIEEKYLNLLSPKLDRYRVVQRNPFKANFRCPYCGDSKKSKTKARGNVYTHQYGHLNYRCFNCGIGRSIENLLKDLDSQLHDQYLLETFKKKGSKKPVEDDKSIFEEKEGEIEPSVLDELMDRVVDLPKNHRAVQYLKDRRIPEDKMKEFYYVDDMQKVEELSDKYRNKIVGTEERVCLPYYNRKGRLIGCTFRALEDHPIKYLDIRLNENERMIYNIDGVDLTEDVYVVEGPMDSLFLPNCVAAGSSDLRAASVQVLPERMILIYDNQPRNRELLKIMKKSIKDGYRHFIWPRSIRSKDINDLVRNNEYTTEELPGLINRNTYGGLTLRAKFNEWKRLEI